MQKSMICGTVLLLAIAGGCRAHRGAARGGRPAAPPALTTRANPTPTDLALVREVVAKQTSLPAAKIDVSKPLNAQGAKLDELDVVELVLQLEDKTGVSIPDAHLAAMVGSAKPSEMAERVSVQALAGALTLSRAGKKPVPSRERRSAK